MWSPDNVFGFDWTRANWTYLQAAAIFPNIARNLGISRYCDTVRNDRFRGLNRIGAGVVSPWGDLHMDVSHRLSVHHYGVWEAWDD